MKRVLLDHLRRNAWLLAAAALFTGLLGWGLAASPESSRRQLAGLVTQIGVMAGPLLLSIDLQRGVGRSMALLPLTREQVARAWWLAAVAAPSALLSVALVTGSLLHALFSAGGPFPAETLAMALLTLWLYMGASLWLLAHLPTGQAVGWKQQVAGTGWGLLIGGGVLLSQVPLNAVLLPVLLTLGVGGSVLGWFLAGRLVEKNPRPEAYASPQTSPRAAAAFRPGRLGGVPYLTLQLSLRALSFGGLFIGGLSLYHLLASPGAGPSANIARVVPFVASSALPLFLLCGVQFLLPQLRSLRALPLSTVGFASVVLGLTLLPVLMFGAIILVVLAATGNGALTIFFALQCLLYLAVGALVLLAFILLGGGKRAIAFAGVLFLGCQIAMVPLSLNLHGQADASLLAPLVVGTFAILLFVFFALPPAIARSGRIYRTAVFGSLRPVWARS